MKRSNRQNRTVCTEACRLLLISFALILTQLFAITLQLVHTVGSPTYLYTLQMYRGMLEYIMLDITIAVVGAFLIDITVAQLP